MSVDIVVLDIMPVVSANIIKMKIKILNFNSQQHTQIINFRKFVSLHFINQ